MATVSRPFGVTIVAVIAWLNGVWSVIQGVLGLIAGAPTWNVVAAWVVIFVGALTVIVSLGLFRGNPGARVVVAIVFTVGALVAIATASSGGVPWAAAIPTIVLSALGLVLLFTPRANAYFRG